MIEASVCQPIGKKRPVRHDKEQAYDRNVSLCKYCNAFVLNWSRKAGEISREAKRCSAPLLKTEEKKT